ncbi:hypothetical protein JZK55_03430 [Dissulfurispira thermophila]|uniref:Type I restriction modification DNA specificity domain-containing protein n=1 Tax=Dissulfurispira thermophila TaxID=2715679 RepID=A0A7G1GZV8_9BACT|nr:restriction endonuclease subunit S [Dissulfurispira thermophila]BCB95421.1 hypothetical protein JZK55_03430 [Dissulfurispira thermophila]
MIKQINSKISTDYKMTELGPLPQEWKVVKLGDCLLTNNDVRFSIDKENIETVCFIPMSLIPEENLFISQFEKRKAYEIRSGIVVYENDLLIAKITPCFENGKQGIVKGLVNGWGYATTEVIPIRVNDKINLKYIAYYFKHPKIRNFLAGKMEGSTGRQRLPKSQIENLKIALPPLAEQRKIAAILSTVQKAIETEGKLIERTKELKKAMMHKLFTEGIGWLSGAETSQKQTEIGPIPKSWEVVKLGEEIADITMGQSPPGETYNTDGNGFPFLQGKAEFRDKHPKHVKYTTKPKKIAHKNSILLSVRAPVGDVNIADKEYCIGRGLAAINGKQAESYFIFYYFLYNKNNIERLGSGSTFKSINKSQIENLKIPLPPLPDQQAIADILSTIDQKIEHHTTKKQKLEELFRTLLHELMTARVRVDDINLEFLNEKKGESL